MFVSCDDARDVTWCVREGVEQGQLFDYYNLGLKIRVRKCRPQRSGWCPIPETRKYERFSQESGGKLRSEIVRFRSLCSNLSSNESNLIASSDQNHPYEIACHCQKITWIAEGRAWGRVVVREGGSLTPCHDDILIVVDRLVDHGKSKHWNL